MWSFSGPTPRPSRISIVMERDTTSRLARSLAEGAYLKGWGERQLGACVSRCCCEIFAMHCGQVQ